MARSAQARGVSLMLMMVLAFVSSLAVVPDARGATVRAAQAPSATDWFNSVAFVDANTGWAAGAGVQSGGTVFKTTNGGGTWTAQISGAAPEFYSVSFVDLATGWAVGDSEQSLLATILKTTDGGATWTAQDSGTTDWLCSVDFVNASTGWAVGGDYYLEHGAVLKTTDGGVHWTAQTPGTEGTLRSVHFVDPSVGWAVGDGGTILKTTNGGAAWTVQSSGTTNGLSGVQFISATTGWAVGGDYTHGTILKTTDGGANWIAQTPGTIQTLRSVHFVDANTGWAVGGDGWPDEMSSDAGTILKTINGGTTWTAQTPGTMQTLTAVNFVDAANGWAVGNYVILNTRDGGTTWVQQAGLLPKATVYTPVAPSTMYRGHSYTIYGYVAPRHTSGTYLATLKFYLRNSHGVYVYHNSVNAKRYYYSTTKTKYKATVSLPHSGRWRVRAYHSDAGHAPSYSGYDYITVK